MNDVIQSKAVPIYCIGKERRDEALAALPDRQKRFAEASGFQADAGRIVLLPGESGEITAVLFGLGERGSPERTPFVTGTLGASLPAGTFALQAGTDDDKLAMLGCKLGAYRFDRYRKSSKKGADILPPDGVDLDEITRMTEASFLARDLVNIPANDLGPAELADAAIALAKEFGAKISIIEGKDLADGFPMIQAVGEASSRAPRLVDMVWGDEAAPKITLVGKGVIFDTGGLDIKPAAAMLLMKKDMGGAANVLGLARLIMASGLKVRLRVLIPAVENAIAGAAFRPGDVLKSRKGLTVEIGNTDAEGRLVLADALTLAEEEAPEIMISMATLTGAARVALGPDVPPFYTHDETLAAEIEQAATDEFDPLWRLPLWPPYDAGLSSKVADMNNVTKGGFAGSITAALFLNRFVKRETPYAHFDIYGWNPAPKPSNPEGGEAQGIRALFHVLDKRYGRA